MSFYRNYRPKDFGNLVGQDHVRITLLNAIKTGNLAHAYLFTGPRGTGKTSTARLLAKGINCVQIKEKGFCDGCELCLETDQGKLIDIIEIDAASNRGIDEMRDLREKINYAPTRAPNKIYIIDEVHMLTKEAFNALLKTLEEPPSQVYFILATTEIHKVPETIISRCQRFDFKRIDDVNLLDRLRFVVEQEGIEAEENALLILAKQARGGLRDALGLLEQLTLDKKLSTDHVQRMLGISDYAALGKLFDLLKAGEANEAIQTLQSLYQQGFDLVQFSKDFLEFLRQKMVGAVAKNDKNSITWTVETIQYFQEAYEKQRYAVIAELPLEVAIVKACLKHGGSTQNQGMTEKSLEVKTEKSAEEDEKKKPLVSEKALGIESDSRIIEEKIEEKVSEKMNKEVKARTETEVIKTIPKESPLQEAELVESTPAKLQELAEQQGNHPKEMVASETNSLETSFNLEQLEQMWEQICAKVNSPIARSNLKASRPKEIQGKKLTLVFSTNFHKDKLFHPQFIEEAENAILASTGVRFALHGIVDTQFKMVPMKSSNVAQLAHSKLNSAPENAKLLEQALEIFGGEVVE